MNQNGSCFNEIIKNSWPNKVLLTAHFCRINSCHIRVSTKCKVMEDTQVVFSQEDEIRGFNVQLDMEGTNSNGHGG
jgi:hypothetical protein